MPDKLDLEIAALLSGSTESADPDEEIRRLLAEDEPQVELPPEALANIPNEKTGLQNFAENVSRMGREQRASDTDWGNIATRLALGPLDPVRAIFAPRTELEREFIAEPVGRGLKMLTLPFQSIAGMAQGLERGLEQTQGQDLIPRALGTFGEVLGGGIERMATGAKTAGETFTPAEGEELSSFIGRGIEQTPELATLIAGERKSELARGSAKPIGEAVEIIGEALAFPGAPKDPLRLVRWLEKKSGRSLEGIATRIAKGAPEASWMPELREAAERFQGSKDFARYEKGAIGEVRGQRADVRESIRGGVGRELKAEQPAPDVSKILLREMGADQPPTPDLSDAMMGVGKEPPPPIPLPKQPPAGAAIRPPSPVPAGEEVARPVTPAEAPALATAEARTPKDYRQFVEDKLGVPWREIDWKEADLDALRAEYEQRHVPVPSPKRVPAPTAPAEEVAGYTLPAYSRSVPGPSSVPTGAKPMSPAQARRSLTDVTAIITRQGGQATEFSRTKGLMGFYDPRTREVVTRRLNDATFWHEFGHWLEDAVAGAGKGATAFAPGQAGRAVAHLAQELDPLGQGLKVTAVSSRTSEGFAEFLRLYATNNAQARKVAPQTAAWLENTAVHANPEVANAVGELRKIQAAMTSYAQAPVLDRIHTMVVKHGEVAVEDVRAAVSPVTHAINALADDTAIAAEMARRAGLSGATDPAEWVLRSRNTPHAYWIENGTLDFDTRAVNGPGLRQIVQTAKDPDLLVDYMLAREFVTLAKERNIPPPTEFLEPWLVKAGPPDHARVLEQMEAAIQEVRAKQPHVAKAADDLFQKHADAKLDYLSKAGVVGQDDIARMKRAASFYAPTRRFMEYSREIEERVGTGLGFLKRKSKKGSLREIFNPIQQTVLDDAAALKRAAVNQVGIGLVRMVERTPQEAARWGLRFADPNKVPKVALKGMLEDILADISKAVGMKPEEMAARLELGPDELTEQLKIWRIFEEAPEGRQYMRVLNKTRPDGTRFVPNKGDEIWLEVPKDVRTMLAAPEGADSTAWKIMDAITGTFRKATTGHVAFGIADFFRNIPNASIMSPGVGAGVSKVPGVGLAQALGRGIVGAAARIAPKTTGLKKWADLYGRLDASRSTLQTQPGHAFKPHIANALTGKKTAVRKVIDAIFDEGSRAFSDAIRIGEVRARVLKEGWDINALTPNQIAALSKTGREIGTDFSKRGAQFQALARLTPFWRPAVGGEASLWRNVFSGMKKNPVATTSALFSSVAIPSSMLWYANHDQPWYRDRPEWERKNYWMFKIGDGIWRIPKPPGSIGTLATLTELALDMAFGDNPRATTEALHAFLGLGDSFIPLGSNPVARWVVERVAGVRFDPGEIARTWLTKGEPETRPVIPRGMEDLPPEQQAYPETGPTARALAASPLGVLTGKSPIQTERSIQTFTGPLGGYGLQLSDALARFVGAEEKPLPTRAKDIPLVSRFVGQPVTSTTPARDEFYERSNDLTKLKKRIAAEMAAGRKDQALELMRKNGKLLQQEGLIEAVIKRDRLYRGEIRSVRAAKGMSPDERLKRLRDLQERSNDEIRKALTFLK